MSEARRELWWIAGLAVVAVGLWALLRSYPNYDAYYHLVWGRELISGARPGIEVPDAPTAHPLYLLLCSLLALVFGEGAERVLVLVCVLSLLACGWAVMRLGRAVYGTWPGVAAAALTVLAPTLLLYAARGYVDMPFLALVLWAAALEATRPRRGMPVMVLLTLAGLLRPEAWLLAGLYWLWCAWPRDGRRFDLQPALLAVMLAAPVLWVAFDWWATGNPLYAVTSTGAQAEALGRERGLASVPRAYVGGLEEVLRAPLLLLAVVGLAIEVVWRRGRRMEVPAALFATGTAAFVGAGLAGLSLLPRYLTVPAVTLTIFAGLALTGWTLLPREDARRSRWAVVAAGVLVLGVLWAVVRVDVPGKVERELSFVTGIHDDLVSTLNDPAVRSGLACGPL
ncbi:MAG: hypothetical protein ACKOFC_03600, partial [Solirubrobacterales bacterium]